MNMRKIIAVMAAALMLLRLMMAPPGVTVETSRTVRVDALPPEARSAAICYLRGKRPEGLKLPTSSYIIVSGETGEVDARVSKGRFRLYRR